MHYNWKCCSFYPNDFGASALLTKHLRKKMFFVISKQQKEGAFMMTP